MSQILSNIFLSIYIIGWLITLIWYQKKTRYFDAASIIICSYICYATCSIILFNHQSSAGIYKDIKLFPFLYLYVMLMIALSPIMKYGKSSKKSIQKPSVVLLNTISIIFIVTSLLQLPFMINNFQTALVNIVVNSQGMGVYQDSMSNIDSAGIGISNIPAIMSNALLDIGIILFFYYLTLPKKNTIIIIGLFISIILGIISPIANGLRGGSITIILTLIVAYFAMKQFIDIKTRKRTRTILILVCIAMSVPISAITNSRFDTAESSAGYSVISYAGQENINFNNYGLNAGGVRYGDRTFNLFKRLFYEDVPANFTLRRHKYSHLKMDDNVFYTFVGDFTLDFGPYFAPIIFLLFTSFVNKRSQIKNGRVLFHQLILIYFVMCICMQGGMYLFSFSDIGGNLRIITFMLVYCLFKYDYIFKNKRLIGGT